MIAVCINDKCDYPAVVLPVKEDGKVAFDDIIVVDGSYSIFQDLVGYSMTIGEEYTVYGILQYDNQLFYLVRDDTLYPVFVPHRLMKVTDNTIPYDWSMNVFELEKGTLLIIGYKDLTVDYDSMCGLIEWNDFEFKKFLKYKEQMERWL